MSEIVIFLSAVVGLFAGSAVWTIARNQARKRPFLATPTCDAGGHRLPLPAWLPLYGFGRVRRCPVDGAASSPWRIRFELAVAGYFALAASQTERAVDLVAVLVFTLPLLVILLVDAWTRLIHTNVIGLGILAGLVFALLDGPGELAYSALAMVVATLIFGAFFFLAALIYRNVKIVPFGLGDVYLAAMIGAMVRLDQILPALLYGIFLAGAAIALLLLSKRVTRKQAVPYGPYLCLGALIVLVV